MKSLLNFVMFTLSILMSTNTVAQATPEISQAQLLSLQSAEKKPAFIVLDVRSEEEYQQGHIANAVNVSHDQVQDKLAQLTQKLSGDKSTLIIVHCRSGRRAQIAQDKLIANGFTQVRHLTGDMNAWQQNNLPLVNK